MVREPEKGAGHEIANDRSRSPAQDPLSLGAPFIRLDGEGWRYLGSEPFLHSELRPSQRPAGESAGIATDKSDQD